MLYPTELRAQHATASGDSIIAETWLWMKVPTLADTSAYRNHLTSALSIFFLHDFNNLLEPLMLRTG
jgi:hypothetical protein